MHANETTPRDFRRNKRPGRIRGVGSSAKLLGVSRTTLYRLLTGKTRNPALLNRYHDLLKIRSKTKPSTYESTDQEP